MTFLVDSSQDVPHTNPCPQLHMDENIPRPRDMPYKDGYLCMTSFLCRESVITIILRCDNICGQWHADDVKPDDAVMML